MKSSASVSRFAACRLFACFVWRRFHEVRLAQAASSLTFTTLLALVPLLAVILAVLAQLPVFRSIADILVQFVNSTIVPRSAAAVVGYLDRFKQQAAGLTAVGTGAMAVTSLLLIQTIDNTFNLIWRIRTTRPWWIRLPVYTALLLFAPPLAGISLSATAYLFDPALIERWLPGFSGSLKALGVSETLARFLFDSSVLWLLYRIVPNCHVPARHAAAGAFATALLLEAAKWGFACYLARFDSYRLIYGAFGAVPAFLVWLHLLWLIILSGALFTACLSYWRGLAFLRSGSPQALFDDITAVLLLLYRAQQHGRSLREGDFRLHINAGYDELANLLDTLEHNGYIVEKRQGWQLARSARDIRLARIFTLFVYDPAAQPDSPEARSLSQLMQPAIEGMDISLADWAHSLPADPDEAGRKTKNRPENPKAA